ncbi:MAG: hypothetical protein ACXVQQ_02480 [Gaiellaceae bacterium]
MSFSAKRAIAVALGGALLMALAAGIAAASTSSVTITSPRSGSTIAARSNAYTAVAGGVSFAAANPQTTRFYLRRDGCGTSNDNPHLSTTGGTDAGDGCGLIVDSVVGLGGDADQSAFVDFPASDGVPLAIDTSNSVSGQIDLAGTAIGLTEVDVSMEALVGGQGVDVGSTTVTAVLDPTLADNVIPFSFLPSAALANADLQGLDLRVHIHGPSIDAGFMGLSGKAWVDVPSFTASVNRSVSISVDDPTFAHPVPARIDSSGSAWSVAIPTPAIGKHTIYAASTQGFDTSAPAVTTFTVKR